VHPGHKLTGPKEEEEEEEEELCHYTDCAAPATQQFIL
jgi:hypothetical protein